MTDKSKEARSIEYISEWVFSVDGSDRTVYATINSKKPKDLKKEVGSTMKALNVRLADKSRWNNASEFVDKCEKCGFPIGKAKKGKYLISFLEAEFGKYIGIRDQYDFNSMTSAELKNKFGFWYDNAKAEEKVQRLDILVSSAIDFYKDNKKSDIEDFVSYKKKVQRGDYKAVDKEYESKGYISSSFYGDNSKLDYFELHLLMSCYRYSKRGVDIFDKECVACGTRYSSLLCDKCPNCGESFAAITRVLNGRHVTVSDYFVTKTAEVISKLLNGKYEYYASLMNVSPSEEVFIDGCYSKRAILDRLASTLIEEKMSELERLSSEDPEESVGKLTDIKRSYSHLHPDLRKILEDAGYPEQLSKTSSEIKKRYLDKKTDEFRSKVSEVTASRSYAGIKGLLDEYEFYELQLQNRIRKNGLYDSLRELFVEVSEGLSTEVVTAITDIISGKYDTYSEAKAALESIDSIIASSELPVEEILTKKGIDIRIRRLEEKCELLRLKEATSEVSKQTDMLFHDDTFSDEFAEKAKALILTVEGLNEDELRYYQDKKQERYEAVKCKLYLATMVILLKSECGDTASEKALLDEVETYIDYTSGYGDHAELREQCISDYRNRLEIYQDNVRIELIQAYTDRINEISHRDVTVVAYNDALGLREEIRNEKDEKVRQALASNGLIAVLDETIVRFKSALDKRKIKSLVNHINNLVSADEIEYKDVDKYLKRMTELDDEQTVIFNGLSDRSAEDTIGLLQSEMSLADECISKLEAILAMSYEDIDYAEMGEYRDMLAKGGSLHIAIVKGDPVYSEYIAKYNGYKEWQYGFQAGHLSGFISRMPTVSSFKIYSARFMDYYESMDQDARDSAPVKEVLRRYGALRNEYVRVQFSQFRRLLNNTRSNCTEENMERLEKQYLALIDRESAEFRACEKEYNEVMSKRLKAVKALIKEMDSCRGLFGTKLKKNRELFIKKYEAVKKVPQVYIDRLPKGYRNTLNSCKNDYEKLIEV